MSSCFHPLPILKSYFPEPKIYSSNERQELREGRSVALPTLDGVGFNATPRRLYAREKDPASILQKAGWV